MILKFNGQYLDFNADVDIEKKVKLFEEIDSADGDVSYEFQITLTSENLAILGPILPDSSDKVVYSQNDCEVLNDEGSLINRGSLRIERIIGGVAYCSFLGGNSNWFAMLSGNMTELRLSQYDKDINESNIVSSWNESEGIVFPIIDTGKISTRGYISLKTEDFIGCFYLKTLVKEVFTQVGIKIQGEVLEDWLYNNMIVVSNNRSVDAVNINSFRISTDIPQTIPAVSQQDIEFNLFTGDYFLGSEITTVDGINFIIGVDCIYDIDISVTASANFIGPSLYVNGALPTIFDDYEQHNDGSTNKTTSKFTGITLFKDDSIKIHAFNNYGAPIDVESITFSIKPRYVFKAYGNSAVPLISNQEFISNVFSVFNIIPSYDVINKTLTLNLFDKIKEKEPIDISEFIEVNETDYSEFISNYGEVNKFQYSEGSDVELAGYNAGSFVKYGAGEITCDNNYIESSVDVVSSDFSSPISYINRVFEMSMEKINYVDFDDADSQDITSVTNSAGVPRFNINNADQYYRENDLIELDTTTDDYNGDFVISAVTSTYITVIGLDYSANATGTAIKRIYRFSDDDNFYLMVKTQYERVRDMSKSITGVYVNQGFRTFASLAYFNILRNTAAFEETYKQGISFGSVNNPLSFQKTLLEKYWKQFERILNDPVMLKVAANLPLTVYNRLDFLRPVTIRSKESSNLYYVNRISGYKKSYTPCELELIKLP